MVARRFDQPNPAALRRFWNAYLIAEETMLQTGAAGDPR